MPLSSAPQIFSFDPHSDSATQEHNLGSLAILSDGRCFRYGHNSTTAAVRGNLQVGPADITNHQDMAVDTILAGATSITGVTPGATGGAADIYQEGFMVVNDDTGEGVTYLIKTNPTITASTAFTLTLAEPIELAFGAGTTVSLYHNPYKLFTEAASVVRIPTGVAMFAISASEYGWLQTRGVASVLADGTPAADTRVVSSGSVAGAIVATSGTYSTSIAEHIVGYTMVAGVDTERRGVYLTID